jgi:uncharacterized SAM-binding protein YcdF (DUF218 family)
LRVTDPSGWFFSPAGLTVALIATAVTAWRTNWSPRARRLLVIVAVFYAVSGFGVIPLTIARVWSYGYGRFEHAEPNNAATAIVVLGAGDETVLGWEGQLSLLNPNSGARVLEAARLFKLINPMLVVAAGGESDRETNQVPSAILMFDELVRLGVPAAQIQIESRSLNTHDHAVFVTPILRERKIDRLVLVTSDIHMRRAVGTFRASGWEPIAAVAPNPSGLRRWRDYWAPGFGLGTSGQLAHELLGVSYYIFRGWWRP